MGSKTVSLFSGGGKRKSNRTLREHILRNMPDTLKQTVNVKEVFLKDGSNYERNFLKKFPNQTGVVTNGKNSNYVFKAPNTSNAKKAQGKANRAARAARGRSTPGGRANNTGGRASATGGRANNTGGRASATGGRANNTGAGGSGVAAPLGVGPRFSNISGINELVNAGTGNAGAFTAATTTTLANNGAAMNLSGGGVTVTAGPAQLPNNPIPMNLSGGGVRIRPTPMNTNRVAGKGKRKQNTMTNATRRQQRRNFNLEDCQAEKAELEQLEAEEESLRKDWDALTAEYNNKRKSLADCRDALRRHQQVFDLLKEQLIQAQNQPPPSYQPTYNNRKRCEQFLADIEQLKQVIATLKKRLASQRSALEAVVKELNNCGEQLADIRGKIKEMAVDLVRFQRYGSINAIAAKLKVPKEMLT